MLDKAGGDMARAGVWTEATRMSALRFAREHGLTPGWPRTSANGSDLQSRGRLAARVMLLRVEMLKYAHETAGYPGAHAASRARGRVGCWLYWVAHAVGRLG